MVDSTVSFKILVDQTGFKGSTPGQFWYYWEPCRDNTGPSGAIKGSIGGPYTTIEEYIWDQTIPSKTLNIHIGPYSVVVF